MVFPENQPLASVRVRPHPGWIYAIEKRELDKPIDNHGEQISDAAGPGSGTATLALIVSIVALLLGAGGLVSGLAARRRSS